MSFEKLEKIGIVPVVTINDAGKALPLAKALAAGGIPCAEITLRTEAGLESLRRIRAELPEVLAGAGTVLTVEQVDKAAAAGASFIVSPGFSQAVVERCLEKNVPVVPGCANPPEMQKALELGLKAVKFFPAEQAGGLDYIKAVSGPFTSLKFMPTGGISAANIGAYTRFAKIIACGGSWMAAESFIKADNFAAITGLCKEAVAAMLGFSFTHLGINVENEVEAKKASAGFGALFGFLQRETSGSIFASEEIEVMKAIGNGSKGHIAIAVNSVVKAKYHLESQGVSFNEKSVRIDEKGILKLVYLRDEIAGFAVHLVQRT
jgi:2-dehydro-3-deoxyphosphogluconate aldolase/(4S)-4-hydroxy-2-oxoglutarate aldolase